MTDNAPRRTRNFIWILVGLGLVGAVTAYVLNRYELVKIGSSYIAKTLCSEVFVAKRPADKVIAEDIYADNPDILKNFDTDIDKTARTITASINGFAKQTAIYRPGIGCSLALGVDVDTLKAQATEQVSPIRPEMKLWPEGGIVNLSTPQPGVNRALLEKTIEELFTEPDRENLRRTRAIVVVHKGRIIAEKYAPGISPKTPLLGWSMTKTVTNALTGILVRDGKLSIDQQNLLAIWSKEGDPRAKISVDDLLRMSSGLSFDESYDNGLSDIRRMLFREGDKGTFAADKSLKEEPGTNFEYSSGTTNILTKVLKRAHGGSPQDFWDFPRKALFEPLGMTTAVFEPDAAGNLVGSSYMYASARDWARLGQLYLQDGVWNGKNIFLKGWVDYSRKPSKAEKMYGAHIWVGFEPQHRAPKEQKPSAPDDAYFMLGHDGQIVAIIPSYDLVIVRLGLSRKPGSWKHGVFVSKILAAIDPAS